MELKILIEYNPKAITWFRTSKEIPVIGTFTDREMAERCLVALAARNDVLCARIVEA